MTMSKPFALHVTAITTVGVLISSCDRAPVTPTTFEPGGTFLITRIVPSMPSPDSAPQAIKVKGGVFQDGISLIIGAPDGRVTVFTGSDFQELNYTTLEVRPTLGVAGTYAFTVRDKDGRVSDPMPLVVQTRVSSPTIASATSATGTRSKQPQLVHISGANFIDGLEVMLTAPDGTITTISGDNISAVTDTDVRVNLQLSQLGTYFVEVVNPSGESSCPKALTITG